MGYEIEGGWLLKASDAQEALGLDRRLEPDRSRFAKLRPHLFSLTLNKTLSRYPLDYLQGLFYYADRDIVSTHIAKNYATGAFALTAMANGPDKYANLLDTITYDDMVPTHAFRALTGVGEETLRTWRQNGALTAEAHGTGRNTQLLLPRSEIDRISEWHYPNIIVDDSSR